MLGMRRLEHTLHNMHRMRQHNFVWPFEEKLKLNDGGALFSLYF